MSNFIKPKMVRIMNSLSIDMVPIKKGSFMMGEKGEQKKVKIEDDFYIGKYPVTVGEFRSFVKDTNYKTDAEKGRGAFVYDGEKLGIKKDAYWDNPYFEQTDNHPVVCVSWYDTQEYIKWLNQKTQKRYILPTEKEWEYACRAKVANEWSFGGSESKLGQYVWYDSNSDNSTQEVGKKLPNQWGLYDMHGNVWEWCDDWYDKNIDTKTLRGGSWSSDSVFTRSAIRIKNHPFNSNYDVGFRLLYTKTTY